MVRRGHAIEARVYAEDPARSFMPSPGKITYLRVPGRAGRARRLGRVRRLDGAAVLRPACSPSWSVWAPTREQAIARLLRALGEYVVHGITTNLAYLRRRARHPDFRSGEYDTGFCARYAADLLPRADPGREDVALIAAALSAHKHDTEQAEAFAAHAGDAASRSRWLRLGRARVLRGGHP